MPKWLGLNYLSNLETLKHVLVLQHQLLQHSEAEIFPLLLGDLSGLKLLLHLLVRLGHAEILAEMASASIIFLQIFL